jgi:hypothetical protein
MIVQNVSTDFINNRNVFSNISMIKSSIIDLIEIIKNICYFNIFPPKHPWDHKLEAQQAPCPIEPPFYVEHHPFQEQAR